MKVTPCQENGYEKLPGYATDISGSELSSITDVREKIIPHDPSLGLTHVSLQVIESLKQQRLNDKPIHSVSVMICILNSKCTVIWYNVPGIQVHQCSCYGVEVGCLSLSEASLDRD